MNNQPSDSDALALARHAAASWIQEALKQNFSLARATALASEPEVRAPAIRILERSELESNAAESRTNAADAEQLIRYLRPRLTQLGYETAPAARTSFVLPQP